MRIRQPSFISELPWLPFGISVFPHIKPVLSIQVIILIFRFMKTIELISQYLLKTSDLSQNFRFPHVYRTSISSWKHFTTLAAISQFEAAFQNYILFILLFFLRNGIQVGQLHLCAWEVWSGPFFWCLIPLYLLNKLTFIQVSVGKYIFSV